MYAELLETLTPQDRKDLAANGVPQSRVSEWRTGFRYPTRSQAFALATVKGVDFITLEKELTRLEIAKDAEKNTGIASLLKHIQKLYVRHIQRPCLAFSKPARHNGPRTEPRVTPSISAIRSMV